MMKTAWYIGPVFQCSVIVPGVFVLYDKSYISSAMLLTNKDFLFIDNWPKLVTQQPT